MLSQFETTDDAQGTKSIDETKEGGCEVFGFSSDDGKNLNALLSRYRSIKLNTNKHIQKKFQDTCE